MLYNKVLARKCVYFYLKCWKSRCTLLSEDKKKRERLIKQIKNICEEYENTDKVGVRSYIRQCPASLVSQTKEYLAQWIKGFTYIRKNSPEYIPGDI